MCAGPEGHKGRVSAHRPAKSRNYAGPFRKTPDRLLGMAIIRFYQLTLSGFVGNACRHMPTCSEYGYEAIARHGLWQGGWLTLFRVGRCGPGGTHGFDPVPQSLGGEMSWWAPWRLFRFGRKSQPSHEEENLMPFDPVEKLQRFHAAVNAIDYPVLEAMLADDAVYLSGGTGDLQGRAPIMTAFRKYFETYPDQVAHDEKVEQLGDREARSFWSLTATHSGTGVPMSREGVETITFNAEGLITKVVVEDLRDWK